MAGTSPQRPRKRRPVQRPGPGTRQRLLEVAGRVFAAKGYAGATGKEICDRAGANVAAVNYYFGGIEGLYAAVVREAHDRLVTLEALAAAVADQPDPHSKLAAFYRLLVAALTGPASQTWALRVFGREIVSPTRALDVLREKEILPKTRILREIVGELMDLPPDHPAVDRGCVSVMAPCLVLLIADRRTLKRAFPRFGFAEQDAESLAEHLAKFALAGLAACRGSSRAADGQIDRGSRG